MKKINVFECPECEEIVEDERDELYCSICAGDVGRDVRMVVVGSKVIEDETNNE